MAAHPLDLPFWHALATTHRGFSRGGDHARRFVPDVAPFAGVPDASDASRDALGALIEPGETVLLLGAPQPTPPGCTRQAFPDLYQMVCDAPQPAVDGPPIVPLHDDSQRADVLALTALVYPHYFRPRTMDLGRYFGIYDGATLVAMIGERMAMPGFRELSAICTHPDALGRGLARRLMAFLGNDVLARGETPFLHVAPANPRAVALYERNGFTVRRELPFCSITRAATDA